MASQLQRPSCPHTPQHWGHRHYNRAMLGFSHGCWGLNSERLSHSPASLHSSKLPLRISAHLLLRETLQVIVEVEKHAQGW